MGLTSKIYMKLNVPIATFTSVLLQWQLYVTILEGHNTHTKHVCIYMVSLYNNNNYSLLCSLLLFRIHKGD